MWPFNHVRSPQFLVGLDIGSHSVKLAKLRCDRTGRMELVAFKTAPLPPETVVDNAIMNCAAVSNCVRELAQRAKVFGAKCAVNTSGHRVIIKKIYIPQMTAKELEESIKREAEQYIPFDIKDINVDIQILNHYAGQGMMDALLVASKKDVIDDIFNVVETAGLHPVVVDADVFACQNAFNLNYGFQPLIVALVNIGASNININVVANGVTVLTRDIPIGGSLLTEKILKDLNVPWEEAEYYKTNADNDTISSSAVLMEVRKCDEFVSEMLVTEIQRSLDWFISVTIDANIARIFLSGGATQSRAFILALEQRLKDNQMNTAVEIVNPFCGISIDTRRFDTDTIQALKPIAAVAIGLAMRYQGDRQAGENGVRINLAPPPQATKDTCKKPSIPRSWTIPISRNWGITIVRK
ncbi:MAG: type IV pilus assembly protein PilM [Candidatus Magasanikbacteria bacterium]|nr:type IV pilus assembly protein PilM [Candidatus Magasanikbacteria bacterium]